jgi:photosystem II stability/assembly factor-like uncharacterized protein
MTQNDPAALDRQLDMLRHSPASQVSDDDAILSGLLELTAVEWPDRDAGERVLAGAAATLNHPMGTGAASGLRPGPQARAIPAPARSSLHRGDRRWPLRAGAATLAMVAAAVTVLAIAHHVAGVAFRPRFSTTIVARSNTPAGSANVPGGWRLADYLVVSGWHVHPFSSASSGLSCPAASTCYLTAAASSGLHERPGTAGILAVSQDGGASWTARMLPDGISFSTPLQCPGSPATCLAGGQDSGHAVLLRTADSGRTWSALRIPYAAYADQLACASQTRCVGIFEIAQAESQQTYGVLVTTNGGRSWTVGVPTTPGQSPDTITCRGQICVLLDQPITAHAASWDTWFSTDGGMRWEQGIHPATVWPIQSNQLPAPGAVSCAGHGHCWAAITTTRTGPAGNGAVLVTKDGGIRWTVQRLTAQDQPRSGIEAITCPTAQRCWAAGFYRTSMSATAPLLLATHDGGTQWGRVILPPGQRSRGVLPAIGLISCPTAKRCVAIPFTDPDVRQVPVYSLGSR